MGQWSDGGIELGMPDSSHVAINGIGAWVLGLFAINRDRPPSTTDSCSHDSSCGGGWRNSCQILSIERGNSFACGLSSGPASVNRASLGCLWRYRIGIGEGGEEEERDEGQHLGRYGFRLLVWISINDVEDMAKECLHLHDG